MHVIDMPHNHVDAKKRPVFTRDLREFNRHQSGRRKYFEIGGADGRV